MSDRAAPNWYDDGHGLERWWNGKAWTNRTRQLPAQRAAGTAAPTAATVVNPWIGEASPTTRQSPAMDWATSAVQGSKREDSPAMSKARKVNRFLIPGVVAFLAFIGGTAIGGAGAEQADPTTSTAYVKLQAALSDVTASRDDLQQQVDSSKADATRLDERETSLDARSDELATLERRLDKRSAKLDKRAATLTETVAAESTSTASEPATVTNVYYANCDAARAAGAAPVYAGEPGYSRSLDRDGDGVGCE